MIEFDKLDDLARRLGSLVPPSVREGREELQENIIKFLDTAMEVSQGDLTKRGEVTSDVLGNVVDAINLMVAEMEPYLLIPQTLPGRERMLRILRTYYKLELAQEISPERSRDLAGIPFSMAARTSSAMLPRTTTTSTACDASAAFTACTTRGCPSASASILLGPPMRVARPAASTSAATRGAC